MNKRDIQDALRRAADQLPRPDADYAATAPVQRLEVHDHITRQMPAVRRPARRWIPAAALLLVAVVGIGLWYWWQNLMPWSTVYLSLNPAFSIELNRQDQVLEVDDENDAAEPLLEGRSYRGWDLEPTLLALLDDLEQAGYDTATVTFSAESRSTDRATVLELRCRQLLDSHTGGGQTAPEATPAVTQLPQPEPTATHHPTEAPAGWERLSPKEAKDIALALEPSASIGDWKLEEDNDVWYYDMELTVNGIKYDVEIHAVTGEVLRWEQDD